MASYERDFESRAERFDRQWVELLQELRVTQTGVQILTGFLLAMPLQSRFPDLDRTERTAYGLAIAFALAATVLIIAPVSTHRVLFRKRQKDTIVETGDTLAQLGLASLGLSLACAATLVFHLVFGPTAGFAAGAGVLLAVIALWSVVPLWLRSASGADERPSDP
ncbi:DUF6328 family protein [Actinomycetota bacterium]